MLICPPCAKTNNSPNTCVLAPIFIFSLSPLAFFILATLVKTVPCPMRQVARPISRWPKRWRFIRFRILRIGRVTVLSSPLSSLVGIFSVATILYNLLSRSEGTAFIAYEVMNFQLFCPRTHHLCARSRPKSSDRRTLRATRSSRRDRQTASIAQPCHRPPRSDFVLGRPSRPIPASFPDTLKRFQSPARD